MSHTPSTPGAKGWTDLDKIDMLLQIIAKMEKPIPWKEIDLPTGRTLKAVQVMIDKEKRKLRDAKDAAVTGENGTATTPTPATPASKSKKRSAKAASADADDEEPKAKQPQTPRKKKIKAGEDEEVPETVKKVKSGVNGNSEVKAESVEDEP